MGRIACALAALIGLASTVNADDLEAAKLHNKNAARLYDLGRYLAAAKEYELAFEAKDVPEFLFNAAQAYRLAQDYPTAIRFYRSYLRRQPDASNREEVEARISESQKAIDLQRHTSEPRVTGSPPAPPVLQRDATPVVVAPQTARREQRPIYRRAWFWGTLGGAAVVVAVGVGLGIGLSQGTTYPTANTTLGVVKW